MARISRRALLAGAPWVISGVPDDGLRIDDDVSSGIAAFRFGGTPLFDYRYGKHLPKPYIHPFHAPNGAVLTLEIGRAHV